MSSSIDLLPTPIDGLMVVCRNPVGDSRGFLERVYCNETLAQALRGARIEAVNRTVTFRRGTVRGLHFQHPPHAEDKVVACLRGEVFDVAVDLRRGSPTFLKWHAETLSQDNRRSLVIPRGFAHGFQALTDDCELLYLHTAAYRRESEGGIDALDPRIAVRWPIGITERSARDGQHPRLDDSFPGI
jgi:dTDP-4-dehydrorhamnose 3,5-epimerase